MTTECAIGIDVGATKIAGALVTRQGEVVAEERAATDPGAGPDAVITRIAHLAGSLLAHVPGPVCGVGIGTPGHVDRPAGIVRNAVNLGWVEVPVARQVADCIATSHAVHLPVYIENDANVQALGEHLYGAAHAVDTFAHVAIGSGLGSGLLVNGQIIAGASYTAAELGHLVLDPTGRPCACGLHGCVETVVSGPGLVRSVRALSTAGAPAWAMAPYLSAEVVVAQARTGDPLATAVLELTASWLGMTFAVLVAVINPPLIVVGGGLGLSAFDLLVPAAQRELARRIPAQNLTPLQILPSRLHSSAVGASALVWYGH
jgi:glucokinase